MKIVVVSDNHKDYQIIQRILSDNPDADYYFHLGDSEMDEEDLRPFACVRGNVDDDYNIKSERVIDTDNHSIFMCHGHAFSGDEMLIAKYAKQIGCDIALYGHTHVFLDKTINGVRIVNPGSCSRSKDDGNSYAIINIDINEINVKRVML